MVLPGRQPCECKPLASTPLSSSSPCCNSNTLCLVHSVSKRGGRLELKTSIEDSHFSGSASGVPHPHVQKSIPLPCVWLQLADTPFYSAFCLIKEPFRAWHFLFVTLHICCKQTPSHPSFWKAKYTESFNSLSARLFLPPSSHFCVSAL